MLECVSLSLSYGKRKILDNISFTAKPGEITVITGKNGSGKTSLLRCISGECGFEGNITLCGKPVKEMKQRELARAVALLPQVLPRPAVSVEALAEYGRFPYTGIAGTLSEADRAAVRSALEITGTDRFASSLVCHLSGGERQLAYFAMAIAEDCPVMLLDEPTSSLDTVYSGDVLSLIRKMRDEGRTVVIVMHDLADAVEIADRIVTLDGGRIAFDGAPAEFTSSGVPERIFRKEYVKVTDDEGRRFGVFRGI